MGVTNEWSSCCTVFGWTFCSKQLNSGSILGQNFCWTFTDNPPFRVFEQLPVATGIRSLPQRTLTVATKKLSCRTAGNLSPDLPNMGKGVCSIPFLHCPPFENVLKLLYLTPGFHIPPEQVFFRYVFGVQSYLQKQGVQGRAGVPLPLVGNLNLT